jgi:hypothetical protein
MLCDLLCAAGICNGKSEVNESAPLPATSDWARDL